MKKLNGKVISKMTFFCCEKKCCAVFPHHSDDGVSPLSSRHPINYEANLISGPDFESNELQGQEVYEVSGTVPVDNVNTSILLHHQEAILQSCFQFSAANWLFDLTSMNGSSNQRAIHRRFQYREYTKISMSFRVLSAQWRCFHSVR